MGRTPILTQDVKEYISEIKQANPQIKAKDVIELVREIVSNRSKRWQRCVKLYPQVSADAETVRLTTLKYLKKLLLGAKSLDDAAKHSEMIAIFSKPTYSGGDAILLSMIFESSLIE